jgi:hypothetical protein
MHRDISVDHKFSALEFGFGIHLHHVGQTADVVAMPVQNDNEVQLDQIDPFGFCISGENGWALTRVEEDALAAVLNERCVSPIFLDGGFFAEVIVKNGNLRLRLGENCGVEANEEYRKKTPWRFLSTT